MLFAFTGLAGGRETPARQRHSTDYLKGTTV
jgi:hypothetical protein